MPAALNVRNVPVGIAVASDANDRGKETHVPDQSGNCRLLNIATSRPFVGKIVALHLRYLESNLVVPSAVAVRFSIVGPVTVSDESSAVLFKYVSCVAEPRASALAQGFPFSPQ